MEFIVCSPIGNYAVTMLYVHAALRPDVFWTPNETIEVIAWSLHACFSGGWPLFTHDGNVPKGQHFAKRGELLANGFQMALCQIRGDMKFLKELFSFKSSYQHNNCCHMCVASKVNPICPFMAVFLPFAPWLNNMYTHEDIMLFVFC